MSSPGATVQECPLKERYAIEVTVIGTDDSPLPDIALALLNSGQAILNRTDSKGSARFEKLKSGSYRLSLNELDQDAWELIDSEALAAPAAKSPPGDAAWGAPPPEPSSQAIEHTVKQGEGTASVADHYGFFPDTVWDFGGNSDLKDLRKDMNILYPGDKLMIPAKRITQIDVSTGNRYRIRRKGIPATLRIRFLTEDKPRAGIPYLMSTQVSAGEPVADRQGTTDDGGWVEEPIPPSATKITITLGTDPEQEEYDFDVGYVNPIDKVSGVRSRLANLGYSSGDETGEEIGPRTSAALSAFQRDHGLEVTGKLDSGTRGALQDLFQS